MGKTIRRHNKEQQDDVRAHTVTPDRKGDNECAHCGGPNAKGYFFDLCEICFEKLIGPKTK